jgi:hypothetical protein
MALERQYRSCNLYCEKCNIGLYFGDCFKILHITVLRVTVQNTQTQIPQLLKSVLFLKLGMCQRSV